MSIRSRLERLERWRPGRISIWQVLSGNTDMEDLNNVNKPLLQQALDCDPARDVIEERIAAVADPARPLPSTGSPGPLPTNQEDDRA
jgi:hypothetical protein